eukprot:comp16647_c0_seq1/m.14843 comp16647_c0_seq1/g.14843  ORF comp16647_c0_seq1/g.14843 comp16647_c0_seq1/m.14843 type:complete len:566 (-) comp16647_c0_seq1:533-2230(-)
MSPAQEKSKDRLIIFDTTLRDGEQSPGVTLTIPEKIHIARQLSRLGVTVCEAGFPIASDGDFEAVRRIAREVGPLIGGRKSGEPMIIAGLARAKKQDIDRCYEAIKEAPKHRIHTFLATSDIHLEYKLKITREQCVQQVKEMVSYAKSLCDDIEFSTEDAGRSEKDFLVKVISTAIEAGATTINVPDTVGYNTPEEYGALIKYLVEHVPRAKDVVFSTHCHNDLGLATANTLAGVVNGARQVEVTINGIGERAGNTSLEEVVMAITTHPDYYPVVHEIDTYQIMRSSNLVSSYTGMVVQPNKAIVGANAFAHESGIHQDGMLKNAQTYEIIRPETVGVHTSLVMGKHSGRAAFKARLIELGYDDLTDEDVNKAFVRFKAVADTGKTITDQDITAIVKDELNQPTSLYTLKSVQVTCGNTIEATATATVIDPDGQVHILAAVGSGPVNAVFKAITDAVKRHSYVGVVLEEYQVKGITAGSDALGEVTVTIRPDITAQSAPNADGEEENASNKRGRASDDDTFSGHGAHPDILVASAHAYLNAINKYMVAMREPTKKSRRVSGAVDV